MKFIDGANQHEVHGTQTQYGKDVGCEYDQGFPGQAEDGRDRIHGKEYIGHLQEDQRDQERSNPYPFSLSDYEVISMQLLCHGEKTPDHT